jgi:hypothetical protein
VTKILQFDIDGIVPYNGKDAALQGQVTVKYFDASKWVITSIGVDLFHEVDNGEIDLKSVVSSVKNKIESTIKEMENHGNS